MILTVTLNLALDHLMFLPRLSMDKINRIDASLTVPGGKGVNMAAALAVLKKEVIATGFIGGKDSDFIERTLRELGVTTNFTYIDDEIRTDSYIVETAKKTNTLIIEKGMYIHTRYIRSFIENYKRVLNNVSTVMIAGSLPPGIDPVFVGELVDIANKKGVDVVFNVKDSLVQRVAVGRNFKIIKPDVRDTSKYLGLSFKEGTHRQKQAADAFNNKQAEIFILNHGPFQFYVSSPLKAVEVYPKKKVTRLENVVATEDSFLAGFIASLNDGECLEDAARYGLATAISTGQSVNNFPNSINDIKNNYKNVQWKHVK